MFWFFLNFFVLLLFVFFIPPVNFLVICLFILVFSMQLGLCLRLIKIRGLFWQRFCLLYFPLFVFGLMFFIWQGIISYILFFYLFAFLVLLEIFLREFSI